MSESYEYKAIAPEPNQPWEQAIPLVQFAAILGPKTTRIPGMDPRARPRMNVTPGDPDEVWLKVLEMKHAGERHTPTEWRALIDGYRNLPAHPAHPEYAG